MKSKNNVAIIAYVPTVHAGYLKFFRANAYDSSVEMYVLGDEFIRQFPSLVRHLPGVTPEEARRMIRGLNMFISVHILESVSDLEEMRQSNVHFIMPDEDVSHAMAEKYLKSVAVTFDASWKLRWDWGATQAKRRPEGERIISTNDFDRELMRNAFVVADRSPDWWRQIGALLVKDGKVLLAAFNRHLPSEQSEYCYGDPRSNFNQGECIDVSGALHAEVGLIAEAARRGIKTEGCDLYVTTFPCPPCAYACAQTGVRRLYYADGYSLIAGAEELQAKGVEIIHVEM